MFGIVAYTSQNNNAKVANNPRPKLYNITRMMYSGHTTTVNIKPPLSVSICNFHEIPLTLGVEIKFKGSLFFWYKFQSYYKKRSLTCRGVLIYSYTLLS